MYSDVQVERGLCSQKNTDALLLCREPVFFWLQILNPNVMLLTDGYDKWETAIAPGTSKGEGTLSLPVHQVLLNIFSYPKEQNVPPQSSLVPFTANFQTYTLLCISKYVLESFSESTVTANVSW